MASNNSELSPRQRLSGCATTGLRETFKAQIRSSDFRLSWLPGADNCRNFIERFTFCPESLKRRAKHGVAKECRGPYTHPLTLAYEFQELLEGGVVNNRAEIARHCGLSRARVTQVMSLLQLPDDIQEYVMALPTEMQRSYSGRRLQGVAGIRDGAAQTKAFENLVKKVSETAEA